MTSKLDQILEQRQEDYGAAEDNWTEAGKHWAIRFGVKEVTAIDLAFSMIDVKISRLLANPNHIDSILDIQGYIRHIENILKSNNVKKEVAKEPIKEDPNRVVIASLKEDSNRREWKFLGTGWVWTGYPTSQFRYWDQLINPEFKEGN